MKGGFEMGNIIGKDLEAGTYEINAFTTYIGEKDRETQKYVYPEEEIYTTRDKLTINLLDECNGDEDLILD